MPSVHLLHMQDDPLGVLAAQNGIYKGQVIRSLAEVTDDMRKLALDDMMKTTLQSPLESIKMHWLFEGVDRAFTHQHVRQRTANFGQESLRFSVVGPLIDATTLPPELHGTERTDFDGDATNIAFYDMLGSRQFSYFKEDDRNRAVWDWAIMQIDAAYHYLVEHGIAAEEARGLLPHATATRIHYQTDLRALMKVMGERLCTQAQFHWRIVAALVREAIRNYTPDFRWADSPGGPHHDIGPLREAWRNTNSWQFEMIADSGIFRPVCYQTGKCMFMASADRGCTIRPRVEKFAANGVPSSEWEGIGQPRYVGNRGELGPGINPAEWLLNPAAARKTN
jgi:flavin-dependent thymidylate synthase